MPQYDSRKLWETLMLEGFQAGLSWTIILRKREAFRKAFKNFDPKLVERFSKRDVARLLGDPGIVRSRAKIDATIAGARIYLAMKDAGDDFSGFIWGIAGGKPLQNNGQVRASTPLSEELSGVLRKRGFKFVGPVIVYAWMQAAGIVNDHAADCFRLTAVQKMARSCGTCTIYKRTGPAGIRQYQRGSRKAGWPTFSTYPRTEKCLRLPPINVDPLYAATSRVQGFRRDLETVSATASHGPKMLGPS